MKILLVHPPNQLVYDKFSRAPIKRLPIGIAYVAAYMEQHGYDVSVLDPEALDLGSSEILSRVTDLSPDVIGFSCTTPLFPIAVQLAEDIKKLLPHVKIIIGGPHISAMPAQSLEASSAIDFVVFGEGEESLLELIRALEHSGPYGGIAGVGYREGGRATLGPPRPYIQDIDSLPFPARRLFPMDRYRDPLHYDEPYTLLVTSRGCPFKCVFCASSVTWGRRVRMRSTENVLKEIDEVVKEYGIRNITFADDTFTLNRERTIEICKGIVERGYDIRFLCSSRVDTIDESRLEWLQKAGCKVISFGIETGNPDIMKVVLKGINLDQVVSTFAMVKKYGITVHSSYIIGNPGDTHETIEQTIQFALDSGTDEAQFSISTPFPGTDLWKSALEKGLISSQDFSSYKWYYSVAANLSHVKDEDLIEYQRKGYRVFKEQYKGRSGCAS